MEKVWIEMEYAVRNSPSRVVPRNAARRCPCRLPMAKVCFAILLCGLSVVTCGVDGYALREMKNGLKEMSFLDQGRKSPGQKWYKSRAAGERTAFRSRSPSPTRVVFFVKYKKAGQPEPEEKTCSLVRAEVKNGGSVDCTLEGEPCVSKDHQQFDDNAEFAYDQVRGGSLTITTTGQRRDSYNKELNGRAFHLTMTSKGGMGIEVSCNSTDHKDVSIGPVTIESAKVDFTFQFNTIPSRF